jgi:hypothetical protein
VTFFGDAMRRSSDIPPLILISQLRGSFFAACEGCGRVGEHRSLDAALRAARWHAEEHPAGAAFRVTVAGEGRGELVVGFGRGAGLREQAP